jgi:uncharacterized membrane protein
MQKERHDFFLDALLINHITHEHIPMTNKRSIVTLTCLSILILFFSSIYVDKQKQQFQILLKSLFFLTSLILLTIKTKRKLNILRSYLPH